MNIENPALGMYIYKNIFDDPQALLKDIEDNFGSVFKPVLTYSEGGSIKVDKTTRDSDIFALSDEASRLFNDQQKAVYNTVKQTMMQCLTDYVDKYGMEVKDFNYDAWNILKYGVGQKFDSHIDDGPKAPKVISIIAYLNDDYTGGEIEYKNINFSYKPSAGDVIIFPSNYIYRHEVKPVESGIRYSIVNWFRWKGVSIFA